MFAIVAGRFHYTDKGSVAVRDIRPGKHYYNIARDCGDGEEFHWLGFFSDRGIAEGIAKILNEHPELWNPELSQTSGDIPEEEAKAIIAKAENFGK